MRLIVGEGPQRPVIERYAQAHGASAWVSLVGHQNQVERYIVRSMSGPVQRAHETFSLAALEQMSMGVPAVLSDQAARAKMVDDGVQGSSSRPATRRRWLNALRRLHRSNARARMARRRPSRSRPVSGTPTWSIATRRCSSPSPMGTAGRRPARFHPDQWAFRALGGADSRALPRGTGVASRLKAASKQNAGHCIPRRTTSSSDGSPIILRSPSRFPRNPLDMKWSAARLHRAVPTSQGRPSWRLGRRLRALVRGLPTRRACACG